MNLQPCCHPECRDRLGGRIVPGCQKPTRLSGARFGIEGVLCSLCYSRCVTRLNTDQRRSASGLVRLSRVDHLGLRAPIQPRPAAHRTDTPETAAAARTIGELHAQAEAREALAQPRRPCPANERGGHRLVQEAGEGHWAPFTCADCGWIFVPADPLRARKSA